ncbi:MAG: RNA polymerase sigma factor [Saprospiraceae bacterium]|nr:RNA polymerase sigma factor [Saprospiraceae bacterium]
MLNELALELKSGNMRMFRKFYLQFKPEYLRFATRYTRDEEVALDVYHDVFIVLFENITSGKLVTLTSSLKTYVFSIAKHMLLNHLRKQGREIQHDQEMEVMEVPDWVTNEPDEQTRMLRRQLTLLGKSCQEILELFYYRRYSIEAIMHEMHYKNENTVKAHKSRCLQRLREMMQQQVDNHG